MRTLRNHGRTSCQRKSVFFFLKKKTRSRRTKLTRRVGAVEGTSASTSCANTYSLLMRATKTRKTRSNTPHGAMAPPRSSSGAASNRTAGSSLGVRRRGVCRFISRRSGCTGWSTPRDSWHHGRSLCCHWTRFACQALPLKAATVSRHYCAARREEWAGAQPTRGESSRGRQQILHAGDWPIQQGCRDPTHSACTTAFQPVMLWRLPRPLAPARADIARTWWMLREVELARASLITFRRIGKGLTVTWLLPASTKDPGALGTERTHECGGQGRSGFALCPVHALWRQRSALRRWRPELHSSEGAATSQSLVVPCRRRRTQPRRRAWEPPVSVSLCSLGYPRRSPEGLTPGLVAACPSVEHKASPLRAGHVGNSAFGALRK